MASSLDRMKAAVLSVCAALGCSVLWSLGTGLRPVSWLTWLAPLPVLLIAGRIGGPQAFGIAALAFFMGSLNMSYYFRVLLGVPIVPTLAFLLVPSCVFGLAVLVHRHFTGRGSLWKASLSVPALWVPYEYLTSVISPHGTFGNMGYTQMDCLPVLQLASVTGIWGIGFCLFLLPATAAALIGTDRGKAQRNGLSVAIGGLFVLVILYGSWRLYATPATEPRIAVALVSSDRRDDLLPANDPAALKLLGEYSDQVRHLSPQLAGGAAIGTGPIFVLPEKIAAVSDEAALRVDCLFRETAARAKATVIVGLDRGTTTRRFNEARVYSPDGTPKAIYVKQHLIPGFEDVDQPGSQRVLLTESRTILGIQICKDMDFPRVSRRYGNDGVGLMLVPAWDFGLDSWLHARMAIMRGVESGFTIARAAKQGLLTVSDNRGRVRAERGSAAAPFSVLFANAPVSHAATLYGLWGDWFAWLNLAALIGLLSPHSPRTHPGSR